MVARTNIAAQGGGNTILQEENEELKEDHAVAEARVKKLERDANHLTKQTTDLQDLVKIRSQRFTKSLEKLNAKKTAIKIKLNTKANAEKVACTKFLRRLERSRR